MRSFPPLYGMNRVERAKPGAVVLAKADDGNVLMAVQEIGRDAPWRSPRTPPVPGDGIFETSWESLVPGTGIHREGSDSRYYRRLVNAVRLGLRPEMGKTNLPGHPGVGVETPLLGRRWGRREGSNDQLCGPSLQRTSRFSSAGTASTNAAVHARATAHPCVRAVQVRPMREAMWWSLRPTGTGPSWVKTDKSGWWGKRSIAIEDSAGVPRSWRPLRRRRADNRSATATGTAAVPASKPPSSVGIVAATGQGSLPGGWDCSDC